MRFLAILWSLVPSVGLILHILIDMNERQVLRVIEVMGKVIIYA